MPRYYIVTFYRLRSFVLMDRRRVEVLCRHLENFNSLRYKNSDSGTATQDHSLQQDSLQSPNLCVQTGENLLLLCRVLSVVPTVPGGSNALIGGC